MKHQITFAWYIFLAAISAAATGLVYADRAAGGPDDQWWLPFLSIGFFTYGLTRAIATAKKDWS